MVGGNIDRKATCVPNRPWCHVLLARLPPNNGFPPSACCPVCTTLMLLNWQVVYRAEWILSGTNAEEIWRFSQFRNNRCRLKNIQLSIAPYLNFTWPILSNQKPNKNRKNFPMFLISLHFRFSPICSKYPMNRGGAPSVPVMRHFLPNLSLEPNGGCAATQLHSVRANAPIAEPIFFANTSFFIFLVMQGICLTVPPLNFTES